MPAPKPSSQPWRRQAAVSLPAASRIATAILTARSAGHGIVEVHNDPIPRVLVERAFELAHQWPQRAMVLAQEFEHLLRLGDLGKRGVVAQIAEHDDNLAAMAFEDLFVALRDDQLSKRASEEPL